MERSIKELADLIRPEVDPDFASKVAPDAQHLHAIAVDVTKELGMEPNALNVGHVAELIAPHVTAPSREYPKMLYRLEKPDGEHGAISIKHPDKPDEMVTVHSVVVNSDEEASELGEGWHENLHAAAGYRVDEPEVPADVRAPYVDRDVDEFDDLPKPKATPKPKSDLAR